jgi:hypothetical protein
MVIFPEPSRLVELGVFMALKIHPHSWGRAPLLQGLLGLGIFLSLAQNQAHATSNIRLNSASVEELISLEGVDEALALRIVELRDERGSISSVEALRVLDIDPQTLGRLRTDAVLDLPIQTRQPRNFGSVEEVMAEFASEPDVQATQAMALAYTKTNPELVDGWLRASKQAYMLPKLNLQYEKENDQSVDYEYVIEDGNAVAQLDGQDADNDDKFVVKLEWRLDKLIMSSEQIRVINEAQDIVKLRDKVLDEVTRLYFDRRRLQVDQLLNPSADLKSRIETELRLQEFSANLDALTGGAFSASLPR